MSGKWLGYLGCRLYTAICRDDGGLMMSFRSGSIKIMEITKLDSVNIIFTYSPEIVRFAEEISCTNKV
jgi:hypothetical protein